MRRKNRNPVFRAAASMPLLGLAAVLALCLGATTAGATDEGRAERLYTKGLAELHAGRTEAAVVLFEQSVAADPGDVRGLYYRGLGYGRAGRYEEAVADLERVVAANDPSIERGHLELGYALYRVGRLDEAAAELELASKQSRSAGEAALLLGIVESRRGNQEAARAALANAATTDPERAVAARYYQGLAAYRAGDTAQATEDFTWVRQNAGEGPFSREADRFLESLREGGSGRRYYLHAGLALEYDSNVALAPDDDNLAENTYDISDRSDGRAVITAGGRYAVVSTPSVHVALGYDFLQSLHFDLERFDVQTHKVGGDAQYTRGPLSLGVGAGYEHSLLDEESLLNGGTVLPWIRYDEGAFGRTEAYYRMRRRDFVLEPYNPRRDSFNHAAGIRQFFSLGSIDRNVIVGYRYDTDDADDSSGREFDYDGHQFEGGVEWAFNSGLAAYALYAYKLEDYVPASFNRDDDEHTVLARVEKRLVDHVWLVGAYVYRRNQSDQKSFDYSRHITSLGVEVRY